VPVALWTSDSSVPLRHGAFGEFCDKRVDQGGVETITDLDPCAEVVEGARRVVAQALDHSTSVGDRYLQCDVGVVLGEARYNSGGQAPVMVIESKVEG